jgi:hypothetical protein
MLDLTLDVDVLVPVVPVDSRFLLITITIINQNRSCDFASGFDADLPAFALTGGEVKTVSAFKYLGSWLTQGGGVEKEIGVRVGRAGRVCVF